MGDTKTHLPHAIHVVGHAAEMYKLAAGLAIAGRVYRKVSASLSGGYTVNK